MTKTNIEKRTRVPDQSCEVCGHSHSGASGRAGTTPTVGDMSVCIECATPLVFGDGLILHRMTEAELAALSDGEVRALGQAIHDVEEARRRGSN